MSSAHHLCYRAKTNLMTCLICLLLGSFYHSSFHDLRDDIAGMPKFSRTVMKTVTHTIKATNVPMLCFVHQLAKHP